MTAPKPPAGDEAKAPAVLDVVSAVQVDPILGGQFPIVGIVLKAGDGAVLVRPLAGYAVSVDPATVHVITADQPAGDDEDDEGEG